MTLSAENLLIGAALVDPATRQMMAERGILPDDFASGECRTLLRALTSLTEIGAPIELITVHRETARQGHEVPVETIKALMADVFSHGTPDNAPYYADMVVEEARVRTLERTLTRLIADIRRNPDRDFLPDLLDAVRDVRATTGAANGGWYHELVPTYLDELAANWEGRREHGVVSTGYRHLDAKLRGGFHPGELHIVGARPGAGKTVMALEFAHHAARAGHRVLFFSAEMTWRAVLRRAAAEFTNTPTAIIDQSGPAQHDTHQRLRERYVAGVRDRMANLPIKINDYSRPTVAMMRDEIERTGNVGLVLFDYLSLAGDTVRSPSEEQRIAQVALGLQHLAKACHVPVVALSQLNREVERQKPFIPSMANIRDSGQVEANAHVVMLLYRPLYYVSQQMLTESEVEGDLDQMQVIIAKNREGENGTVRLRFDGPTFSVRPYESGA